MNAKNSFKDTIERRYGFTKKESEKIYKEYLKNRILEIDIITGDYTLCHGVFFEKDVMINAINA